MWIVAVDPGETIGVVVYDARNHKVVGALQTADPLTVARILDCQYGPPTTVVIESFPGGGPRTTAAIYTLKVLGFIEYYARHLGLNVVLQVPQTRLHKINAARELVGDARKKHCIDALAHALAFASKGV